MRTRAYVGTMPAESREPAPATRDQVISDLGRHFAEDRLDVEEFEQRVERALKARTAEDLRALMADLPGGAPALLDRGAPPAGETGAVEGARPRLAADAERPERQYVVAVMGGNTRKGLWTPASRIMAYAFWGGAELDFRAARLPAGVTEVVAIGIMGGVDIVVPPDVEVDVRGFALLGGIDQPDSAGAGEGSHLRDDEPPGADGLRSGRTILRVHAFAMMGGVGIDVRYPGESARDARRRRKAALKEARRERRLGRGGDA